MRAELREALTKEEGNVPYAYKDHMGFWTIGIGFLIDKDKGGRLPDPICRAWLDYKLDEIDAAFDREIPWWRTRPENVQLALCQMAYQLGVAGTLGFKKMIACIQAGDYGGAKAHALDSKWARDDTPERAKRVTDLFTKEKA